MTLKSLKIYRLYTFVGALVILWQCSFIHSGLVLPEERRIHHACGIACGYTEVYAKMAKVYFEKSLFPVFPLNPVSDFKTDTFDKIFKEQPDRLVNDEIFTVRAGELGKVWLFFPSLMRADSADQPTIQSTMILLFLGASLVWLWGLSAAGSCIFAVITLVLLTSSELVRYEVFSNPNLFSLPVSVFLFLSGIYGLLWSKRFPITWELLAVSIASIFLGLIREIRTEPFILFAFFLLALLALSRSWKRKVGLLICGVVFIIAVQKTLREYWASKMEEAVAYVTAVGGNPFPKGAVSQSHHELWHPLWCGLGDFDKKYGFEWDDRAAYRRIIPVMRERYGISVNWDGEYFLNAFWDQKRQYPVRIGEYPEYHIIAKEQYLGAIKKDPIWFLDIIWHRIKAIGDEISPISLAVRTKSLGFHVNGYLLVVLALLVVFMKRRDAQIRLQTILIALAYSASLPCLIITAAKGAAYTSIYHHVALGLVLSWAASAIYQKRRASS